MSEQTQQHTPTPWTIEKCNANNPNGHPFIAIVRDAERPNRDAIVHILWERGFNEVDEANAAFIIEACNSYDLLKNTAFQYGEQNARLVQENEKLKKKISSLKEVLVRAVDEVLSVKDSLNLHEYGLGEKEFVADEKLVALVATINHILEE